MGTRNPAYIAFKVKENARGDELLSIIKSAWVDDSRSKLEELLTLIEQRYEKTFDVWEDGCLINGLGYTKSAFLMSSAAYYEGFRQTYLNLQTREVVFAGASESDSMEYRAFLYHHLDIITPLHANVFGFCSFDQGDDHFLFLTEGNIKFNTVAFGKTFIQSSGQPYTPQRIMRLLTEPEKLLDLTTSEDDFSDWWMRCHLEGFVDLLTTAVDLGDKDLAERIMFLFDTTATRDFIQQDILRSQFSDKYLLGEYAYPTDARLKEVIDFLKPLKLSDWRIWLMELSVSVGSNDRGE